MTWRMRKGMTPFLAPGNDMNDTDQLAAQARRDTGIRERSPSPIGSATSEEEMLMTAPRKPKKAKLTSRSVTNSS